MPPAGSAERAVHVVYAHPRASGDMADAVWHMPAILIIIPVGKWWELAGTAGMVARCRFLRGVVWLQFRNNS